MQITCSFSWKYPLRPVMYMRCSFELKYGNKTRISFIPQSGIRPTRANQNNHLSLWANADCKCLSELTVSTTDVCLFSRGFDWNWVGMLPGWYHCLITLDQISIRNGELWSFGRFGCSISQIEGLAEGASRRVRPQVPSKVIIELPVYVGRPDCAPYIKMKNNSPPQE